MSPTIPFALLVSAFFVLPTTFIAVQLLRIRSKYLQAQNLGLPVFISVSTWQNPIWALLHPYLLWMEYLPFGLGKGVKYSYFGWTDVDKGRTHTDLGNAFCVVSPNRLEIVCAEPTVGMEVLQKWRVWTKSREVYQIFETFGKNINSVNGQDWQRHRKIAGQAFRDETYDLVYRESSKQAEQLLRTVEQKGQRDLVQLRNDFALVAMHVLSSAVFGHSYDYGAGLQEVESGHKMSFFASLAFILQNIASVVVFKALIAPDWLLPAYFRKLKLSVNEFQQYLTEATEQEHKAGMAKRSGASLVAALVQANEDAKHDEQNSGGLPMHLNDEELFGNMYIFNLAGFETTSFSLGFTIPYLALDPSLQDWIQEEIDLLFKSGNVDDYSSAFSRLPRCRALMFETLRHHAAAAVLPRLSPPDQPTELYFPSMDKTITVPPDSYVTINFPAIHNSPLWGPDALSYNPKRWITTTDPTLDSSTSSQIMSSPASNTFGEHLLPEPYPSKSHPDAPAYIPWATGARVCPGKKFSQVEFVAVIGRIFSEWRVEPVSVDGMDKDGPRKALQESVGKARFNMTPQLYKPERAGVRWIKRTEWKPQRKQ